MIWERGIDRAKDFQYLVVLDTLKHYFDLYRITGYLVEWPFHDKPQKWERLVNKNDKAAVFM